MASIQGIATVACLNLRAVVIQYRIMVHCEPGSFKNSCPGSKALNDVECSFVTAGLDNALIQQAAKHKRRWTKGIVNCSTGL